MSYHHPNVIFGQAEVWACRWIEGADPRKYVIDMTVRGFCFRLKAAVVDDFGTLVEVDK